MDIPIGMLEQVFWYVHDEIDATISGLGRQRNRCISEPPA